MDAKIVVQTKNGSILKRNGGKNSDQINPFKAMHVTQMIPLCNVRGNRSDWRMHTLLHLPNKFN